MHFTQIILLLFKLSFYDYAFPPVMFPRFKLFDTSVKLWSLIIKNLKNWLEFQLLP